MYEQILQQMREMIRTNTYIMTVHAEEEMQDEDLSIFDIERIILTGRLSSGKGKPIQWSLNTEYGVRQWEGI